MIKYGDYYFCLEQDDKFFNCRFIHHRSRTTENLDSYLCRRFNDNWWGIYDVVGIEYIYVNDPSVIKVSQIDDENFVDFYIGKRHWTVLAEVFKALMGLNFMRIASPSEIICHEFGLI